MSLRRKEKDQVAVERGFQAPEGQARRRDDHEIRDHDAVADRHPGELVEDHADDVRAAGRGPAAEDDAQADPQHDPAVDRSQHGIAGGRGQLEDPVEEVDEQGRGDHPGQAVEDVLPAHGPQAEKEDGHVEDHDEHADGEPGEIIEDDGDPRDPAGDEMVGDEEQGVGQALDGAADEDEEGVAEFRHGISGVFYAVRRRNQAAR